MTRFTGSNLLRVALLITISCFILVSLESQVSEFFSLTDTPINYYFTADRISVSSKCTNCMFAFLTGSYYSSYVALSCDFAEFCYFHHIPKCVNLSDTSMLLEGGNSKLYIRLDDMFLPDQRSSLTSENLALGKYASLYSTCSYIKIPLRSRKF